MTTKGILRQVPSFVKTTVGKRDNKRIVTKLIILAVLFLLLPTNSFAQTVSLTPAPAYAVIINQIRGESCCSPGNLENTRSQLENAVKYDLPTTFVLRYDALADPQYTELILSYQRLHPDLIQTGVMVEIVQSLVADANDTQCDEATVDSRQSTEGNYERDLAVGGMTTENEIASSSVLRQAQDDTEQTPRNDVQEHSKSATGCEIDNTGGDCLTGTYERCAQTECGARSSEQKDNAADALCEVQYKGSAETWFQAQNAFTIGYDRNARTVILDTLLAQYFKVFGAYPTISSAWMIDTDSVNYLHDRYGVVVHQLTREQWGTDSYTLYGGPPHYPYPASRNWIMMPDFDTVQAVTIVRQTVTDPLYNYGDTSSSFTSQPNDYVRGERTIGYFQTLIDNAIHQQTIGFANIGLENSMDGQFQDEYARQLEYIAKLRDEHRLSVVFPDAVGPLFRYSRITTYARWDGERQAIWITNPKYRARIIRNNKEVAITDLRLYSKELKDPYSNRVAKHEGYWVVPFLIDGSRWYAWKDMEKNPHKFIPIGSDLYTDPSRITIGKMEPNYQLLIDYVGAITDGEKGSFDKLKMTNESGIRISVTRANQAMDTSYSDAKAFSAYFFPDRVILPSLSRYIPHVPSQFPVREVSDGSLQWNVNSTAAWSMRRNTTGGGIWYDCVVSVDPAIFSRVIDDQYPYLYPESVGRTLSDTYTRVSVNNTFALAGRNPVRLVLEPHDAMNFPIILDREAEISVYPNDTAVTRLGKLVSSQQQYVDLDRSDPHTVGVTVKMNQKRKEFISSHIVYFAPNCKKDWSYCMVHPVQGVWYVLTKITDWWSERK